MTILKKLFAPDLPVKQTCVVIGRMFPGRYKLRNLAEMVVQADSDVDWRPGDTVSVQQGRVVGRAAGGDPLRVEV